MNNKVRYLHTLYMYICMYMYMCVYTQTHTRCATCISFDHATYHCPTKAAWQQKGVAEAKMGLNTASKD